MTSEDDESKLPSVPSPLSNEHGQNFPKNQIDKTDLDEIQARIVEFLSQFEGGERPAMAAAETVYKLSAYYGAWPPAEVIKEQEAALPGSGERLLRWTEKQTAHRHALEKKQVEGNETRMDRGQYFSLAIALPCLFCGTYLMASLNSIYGTVGGIAVVAIGVVTPTAMHIARGIGHWLGDKSQKGK